MAHIVKVDDTIFTVPSGALVQAFRQYAPKDGTVNYDGLKSALRQERLPGGADRRIGYVDFDAMQAQGLREPVLVGDYEPLFIATAKRLGIASA